MFTVYISLSYLYLVLMTSNSCQQFFGFKTVFSDGTFPTHSLDVQAVFGLSTPISCLHSKQQCCHVNTSADHSQIIKKGMKTIM